MGTPEFAVPSLGRWSPGAITSWAWSPRPTNPAGPRAETPPERRETGRTRTGAAGIAARETQGPGIRRGDAGTAARPGDRHRIPDAARGNLGHAAPGDVQPPASLLPQYRGAAPINWAVINGETETGVTTFLLNHEIDKGAIIGQVRVPILPEDNVGSLYDKLMHEGHVAGDRNRRQDRRRRHQPHRTAARRRIGTAPGAQDIQGGLPHRLVVGRTQDREFRTRAVALSGSLDGTIQEGSQMPQAARYIRPLSNPPPTAKNPAASKATAARCSA